MSQWGSGKGDTVITVQAAPGQTLMEAANKIILFFVLNVLATLCGFLIYVYLTRNQPGSIARRVPYVWRTFSRLEDIATRSSRTSRDAFMSTR